VSRQPNQCWRSRWLRALARDGRSMFAIPCPARRFPRGNFVITSAGKVHQP